MSCWERILLILCLVQITTSGTFNSVIVTGSHKVSELSLVALTFIEKVANIELDAYNVTCDCNGPISSFLYPGHTEALVSLNLTSASSQLEIDIQFIDDYLEFYQLSLENGPPILSIDETLDIFDMARETLQHYQLVFNATYCSQLTAMIGQLTTAGREQTIETGCATLDFYPNASLGGSVEFAWRYKGAIRKHFCFAINKGGFLEVLGDTWGLCNISNAEVKVSEETAERIAFDRAQAYIDELGAAVTKVNAELRYFNPYPEGTRGEDCFVLYPTWIMKLVFDKPYGAGHYIDGYLVGIWADTGDVWTAKPQGYWGSRPPASDETSHTLTLVVIVAPAIVVFGAIILTMRTKKEQEGPIVD